MLTEESVSQVKNAETAAIKTTIEYGHGDFRHPAHNFIAHPPLVVSYDQSPPPPGLSAQETLSVAASKPKLTSCCAALWVKEPTRSGSG